MTTALRTSAEVSALLAAVPEHDRGGRLEQCAAAVRELGDDIGALLVTDPLNVRYLTGFTGSAGMALVGVDGTVELVTDSRYLERAAQECDPSIRIVVESRIGQRDAIAARIGELGDLALEADHVTWAASRTWSHVADEVDRAVVATQSVVEGLRLVKDRAEVARIEAAAAVADLTLAAALPLFTEGASEIDVRRSIEHHMVELGADGPGYDTIVASGPNASRPHHAAGARRIEPGDLVVIDVGACVDGYRSDMTRTFVIGRPDAEQRRMLELAAEAQRTAVSVVAPGVSGGEVDNAAREVIEAAGRGEQFSHGVGHGVGLAIHEVPFLLGSDVPLRSGQVVTVEPGVYRPGFGGVRVEDTVVVTARGCRTLTHHPKEPILD